MMGGVKMSKLHMVFGCIAVFLYLMLFTAGVTRDSAPYRERLSGHVVSSVPTVAATAPPAAVALTPVASLASDAPASSKLEPGKPAPFDTSAFFAVMFLYTPINVAFLALVSAFLGGCTSRITYNGFDSSAAANLSPQSLAFRTENPTASMFRGFLVYLAFMAGIYITTTSPFDNPSSDQYVRFAATLSFFAFVVGYDPTKFRDWIDMVPQKSTKDI